MFLTILSEGDQKLTILSYKSLISIESNKYENLCILSPKFVKIYLSERNLLIKKNKLFQFLNEINLILFLIFFKIIKGKKFIFGHILIGGMMAWLVLGVLLSEG